MSRAYGSNALLLLKREASYGVKPAGNYTRMPFLSCSLSSEQTLIEEPILGQGRDPAAPMLDVINDEGDVKIPLDIRYLGIWLAGLFGNPTSVDLTNGAYEHTFASGNSDLPSFTMEVGLPDIPSYFAHTGVKLNSIALDFQRSGAASGVISLIAQGENRTDTSSGGTPTALTFSRISQFQGSIKQGGSLIANLTSGSLNYTNNLEKIETIRNDGKIEGADPTNAALTGKFEVRFADTALVDKATSGTPIDLEFAYTISATASVKFICHEVYLPKPKLPIDGAGGIVAAFDFKGAKNSVAGRMLTVKLNNDLDGSAYL